MPDMSHPMHPFALTSELLQPLHSTEMPHIGGKAELLQDPQ